MSAYVMQVVCYRPTDAEATAGGGSPGDEWAAMVCKPGATPNLAVFQADGTILPKAAVVEGMAKGEWHFAMIG